MGGIPSKTGADQAEINCENVEVSRSQEEKEKKMISCPNL